MATKNKLKFDPTKTRPMPGSLLTDPNASVLTGKVEGRRPKPDSLPFVKLNRPKGSGYSYWVVKPSGNYTRDCESGREYAQMLLPFLKYNAGIVLLGCIVLDMIRAGEKKAGKGLVVGFMAELSRELSSTRSALYLYAAAAAVVPRKLPRRLKSGAATLKKITTKAANDTMKRLGNVI